MALQHPYAWYGNPPPYQWTSLDYDALRAACKAINCRPEDLLLVLYLESRLNPHIAFLYKNSDGSVYPSAVGLNQITTAAMGHMGITEAERLSLLDMTAAEQMPYVTRYFTTNNNRKGQPFKDVPDAVTLYQVNIAPGTVPIVGPPRDILYVQHEIPCKPVHQSKDAYCANVGLDADGDHQITRRDLAIILDGLSKTSGYKKALAELKGDAPVITIPKAPPPPPGVADAVDRAEGETSVAAGVAFLGLTALGVWAYRRWKG